MAEFPGFEERALEKIVEPFEIKRENPSIGVVVGISKAAFFASLAAGGVSLFLGEILLSGASVALALLSLKAPTFYARLLRSFSKRRLKRQLPFFLQKLSLRLHLGTTPVESLRSACGGSSDASKLFSKALEISERGIPLERALDSLANIVDEEEFSEAVFSFLSVLSEGATKETLLELDRGIVRQIERQKRSLIRHSARSNLFSLAAVFGAGIIPGALAVFLAVLGAPRAVHAPLYFLGFPIFSAGVFLFLEVISP